MHAQVSDSDSLYANESLDEPPSKRPAIERDKGDVPRRLVRVAAELDSLSAQDDGPTVAHLSGLGLAQMTGQIREIEQTALQLGREEGREEFRVKALLHNLSNKGRLISLATARNEPYCKWSADSAAYASRDAPSAPPSGPQRSPEDDTDTASKAVTPRKANSAKQTVPVASMQSAPSSSHDDAQSTDVRTSTPPRAQGAASSPAPSKSQAPASSLHIRMVPNASIIGRTSENAKVPMKGTSQGLQCFRKRCSMLHLEPAQHIVGAQVN
ncbi:hypothetical protein AB1Y20_013674 [Prymnesium parvum]|uniref:Uncharacterized protein n=1 Tax=Prymnesium parvum TaxID=97485 RepID=A0AB34IHB3_PRYPA